MAIVQKWPLLLAIVYVSATANAFEAHEGWPAPNQHEYDSNLNAVGINLGPDFITAAVVPGGFSQFNSNGEPRLLVQQEGDTQYKAFMRQNLFHQHLTNNVPDNPFQETYPNPLPICLPHDPTSLLSHLPSLYTNPANTSSLQHTFAHLKEALNKALHRDVKNVLVSHPGFLSNSTRRELYTQLNAVGLNVLSMCRRPQLLDEELGSTCGNDRTVLLVELNGAALETAIVELSCGVVDMFGSTTHPSLGTDFWSLRALETTTTTTPTVLNDYRESGNTTALLSSLQASLSASSLQTPNQGHDHRPLLHPDREAALRHVLESAIAAHTRAWTPREVQHMPLAQFEIVLSGDVAEGEWEMVGRAVRGSGVLKQMQVVGGWEGGRVYAAACGAARMARLRRMSTCCGCEEELWPNGEYRLNRGGMEAG